MPPRPAVRTRERPTSAIYLGSGHRPNPSSAGSAFEIHHPSSSSPHLANGAPGSLPDLPEPESPVSSHNSRDSGLPSPPATNSTGSGSTGDPGSVARRQRPLSFASDSSTSTSNSSQKTMSDVFRRGTPSRNASRSNSRIGDRNEHDDEDDDEDEDNEDDTARLDRRSHVKSSSENVRALQRVMSLTQRNRMALDKLTRLGSPSPTPRSKSPSHASTTSSSRLRQTRIVSQSAPRDQGASGSETERESTSVNTFSSHSQSSSSPASSSQRPITPPAHTALTNTSSPYSHLRNVSTPGSPSSARRLVHGSGGSDLSDSPSGRRRKRASMATMSSITQDYEGAEQISNSYYATTSSPGRDRLRNDRDTARDITASALAAVASSRRSPVSTRRRAALPREFREDLSTGDTGSVVSDVRTRHGEDADSRTHRLSLDPMTPYRSNVVGRSATLREARHTSGHSQSATLDLHNTTNPNVSPTDGYRRERRQTLRGGSAESALGLRSPGGRTLLGEGLRAAGLTKKEEPRPLPAARPANVFRSHDWSPPEDKGKRRTATYGRSATSMSNYRPVDSPEEERPSHEGRLREHRSTYSLSQPREQSVTRRTRETRDLSQRLGLEQEAPLVRTPLPRSAAPAPVSKATSQHLQDRSHTASPMEARRQSAMTPGPGTGEHSRLMADSLAMFESVVTKLPPAACASAPGTISNVEILKHAQVLVRAADRMASLMRAGTTRALEEQINAEVEGDDLAAGPQMLDVWRQVGGEYREGLRAADELVRSITSFLVDTGSVMRKLASAPAVSDFGSPAAHARHLSLDDEGLRQQRLVDGESGSGRKSVESRRSWEPAHRERDREREDTLRKLGGGRESSLSLARGSPALLAVRERERISSIQPPPPASATRPLSSARRLYVPREQARPSEDEHEPDAVRRPALGPSDSQRTVQPDYAEPSPTPVSRTIGRSRTVAVTSSRPAAEEDRRPMTAERTTTPAGRAASMRDRNADRRKPSVASIANVRGSGPPTLSSLTMPGMATIGVSHHTVSSSPEQSRISQLPRTDSDKSVRSIVTFSHPSSGSAAALSTLQRQALSDERKRSTERSLDSVTSTPTVFRTPAKMSPPAIDRARSEDPKRTIAAARASRLSLNEFGVIDPDDNPVGTKASMAHPADRAATALASLGGRSSARRRTVTDIWPAGRS